MVRLPQITSTVVLRLCNYTFMVKILSQRVASWTCDVADLLTIKDHVVVVDLATYILASHVRLTPRLSL